ncbi:MAG: hypothetical protein RSE13_09390 [Planktothrix sp. GU0601_MAG3]|nr:MAG: hypothetical protein RSE13_09390 [Planktothrix sp. GU0601_MAG3]
MSLKQYVLVDSESISVEFFCRGEGKMWYYYGYILGNAIALESIEFDCAIGLLYWGG